MIQPIYTLPTTPATASPLGVKIITDATEELISIADCREHLEAPYYGDSEIDPVDDLMILSRLTAARQFCEQFTGLVLARKTVEVALDEFPVGAIELPVAPVVEIVSFTTGPGTDAVEVDSDTYTLDDYATPQRLVPVSSWPSTSKATNTIKIRLTVGYGEDSDGGPALPMLLRAAMLLILGHLHENREDSTEKAMSTIPNGAEKLMRPYRVRKGMA